MPSGMGLRKKMARVRNEMKKYPAGQVPAGILQQYEDLQKKLKKCRN